MDSDGFQLVSRKQSKRKSNEVDERNIINEKRQRVRSAKVIENGDVQSHRLSTANFFDVLNMPSVSSDSDDFHAQASVEDDSDTRDSSQVYESDEASDISVVELPRMTVPERSSQHNKKRGHRSISTKSGSLRKQAKAISRYSNKNNADMAGLNTELASDTESNDNVIEITPPQEIKKVKRVTPPIFLFFKEVLANAKGEPGNLGDRHYECFHGRHHILTITKRMKRATIGLENHLRTKFPQLYSLFLMLKARGSSVPPTDIEVRIANGTHLPTAEQWKQLVPTTTGPYDIISAFARQAPWDQSLFEDQLARWIAEEDQPFTVVEEVQFQSLLRYVYQGSDLHIPSSNTMRRRISEMKSKAFAETKELVKTLDSKVSLSLDAWTSSNGYAFLAVVMHYVTKDWKIETRLIGFEEIIGQHTGENFAEIVWQLLTCYDLKEKIIAVTCDNASTNDTMMDAIELRMGAENILFLSREARIRCMPHTIHLSALKLLEAIDVLRSTSDVSLAYQESVTAPLAPEYDNDAAGYKDEADDICGSDITYAMNAINKLRKVVRAVRASPQRRKAWLAEAAKYCDQLGQPDVALMLILDVKTRWSSTHQMLNRAFKFRKAIRSFTLLHEELHPLKLSDVDWRAIRLITIWLSEFRIATTFISSSKASTLSSSYGCFKGLQDKLQEHLDTLSPDTPTVLRAGLVSAHRKLSDYFYTFITSPYYMWAALLDPRMSYMKLREDASGDMELIELIESSRRSLEERFAALYPLPTHSRPLPTRLVSDNDEMPPPVFAFLARYESEKDCGTSDELSEYFNMRRETSWSLGEPIKWWAACSAQFPRLSQFARDIHCIPGSAVAVERIFSGGRDTIALRRASLQPGMVGTLMLVKAWLKSQRLEG